MTAKLTIGPLFFNWPLERRRDFYLRLADEAPVDSVCLGEVVCAKRMPFLEPLWPEVIERLGRAGKEVVLSTPALVMGARELAALRDLTASDEALIEANEVAALALLAGRPHAVGPFVNVYNEGTLGILARRGATRVSLPVELPASALAALAAVAAVELEVQVFGRLPLAISARCYHARAHGLHKDSCQYVCAEDEEGMGVETLDRVPLLAVNGTQTLSWAHCNLVRELGALAAMGIGRYRLSPQALDMVALAQLFRAVLEGRLEAEAAYQQVGLLAPGAAFCDGYFHGREGVALGGGREVLGASEAPG
ncbi:MAG: U32 family peptidase [Alphaproteobacteria bacterium]|nr:U32 family peptidase [Alphaproteobacteria bacterium]